MKLGEFFLSLGVDADQKGLDNFTGSVTNLEKSMKKLKIVAIAAALKLFTDSTVNSTVAVQNFTNQTGLLGAELQKWQIASTLSDITLSNDAATQSLSTFVANLTQIQLGGGNVNAFNLLGIDTQQGTKNPFEILEEMRNSIKGLKSAVAVDLIKQTGLSPQFINVLRLSNKEFQDLFGRKTVLSAEKRKDILELGTAFTNLKISLVSIKDQIVAAFSPALISLTNVFTLFADRVAKAADKMGDMKGWMLAIATGIAALIVAFAPLTAVVLSTIFLVDDLLVLFSGGDSMIGRFGKAIRKLGHDIGVFLVKPFIKLKSLIDGISFKMGRKIGDFLTGRKDEALLTPQSFGGAGKQFNNNIVNNYSINSTSDARTLANSITDQQQRTFNHSMAELNNGALA